MPKRKIPAYGAQPPGQGPRFHADPDQFQRSRPAWRLNLMEVGEGAPWSWRAISIPELLQVRRRLADLEKLEIGKLHDSGSHAVKLSQLASTAQRRLEELKLDDLDALYSLRMAGKPRVWAIQDRNFFELLWWDPEHEVCPSNLRNT